jgi:small multidrug resistance family-3 protein
MENFLWFVLAAVCEIAGCYTAWMWLRLDRTAWWLLPGMLCLAIFAVVLTRVDAALAGRTFAAYGGVYIVSSLLWLAVVERTTPRLSDVIGSLLCLGGAAVILLGARWSAA